MVLLVISFYCYTAASLSITHSFFLSVYFSLLVVIQTKNGTSLSVSLPHKRRDHQKQEAPKAQDTKRSETRFSNSKQQQASRAQHVAHIHTDTDTMQGREKKKKVKERSHASLDVLLHFYFLLLRLYTVNEPQSTKLPVRVTASRLPASLLRGCRPPRAVSLAAAGGDAELPALHRRPSRYR
jgi:hypothetical protein